ncbi:MAG: ferric reductase-like transmembrane domain-containing protein [Pirellulales bacterium]|nr:ferric reductase-like transmembrane domain-containing protein [Pirellulales bacterium]
MSVTYKSINWNHNKRVYDRAIAAGVIAYLATFLLCGVVSQSAAGHISLEVLLLRALGTCAYFMLSFLLCIGPLARLDRRLLPLLYNRRHLGVATFLVALAHGLLATGYYHGFGRVGPFVSLLTSNTNYASLAAFPFETLGLLALVILCLLAVTSHDFWQKNLGPSVWKSLHMLVYPAYGLITLHIAFGALQAERSLLYPIVLALGLTLVVGLHLTVGWREQRRDRGSSVLPAAASTWIEVGRAEEIPDGRAKTVCLPGRERVAIFRHGNRFSAVTNVCAHQRGPLGEGRIIEGCITCPWHGWEYRPENGQSPPPFQEKIATYRVRVERGRVWLDPEPLPPGTSTTPAFWVETN